MRNSFAPLYNTFIHTLVKSLFTKTCDTFWEPAGPEVGSIVLYMYDPGCLCSPQGTRQGTNKQQVGVRLRLSGTVTDRLGALGSPRTARDPVRDHPGPSGTIRDDTG